MNKFLIATILFVAMLSSKAEARNGKFSAGVQFASNWYRNGIAARLDYDFSHRLRLSIDGAYYLTACREYHGHIRKNHKGAYR